MYTLKLTHYQHSVHVQVADLRPDTIYTRFAKEFPDCLDPSPVLRWLDSDNDWIRIRQDDQDFEAILKQTIGKSGIAHIQSGDATGAYEPAGLETLMKRYEKVMDLFDNLSRTIVKLPPITNILIVTKPDSKLTKLTKELSLWLLESFPGITLYVDKRLQDRSAFRYKEIVEQDPSWKDRLRFWTWECHKDPAKQIHLAVTLGGDGTVLYTSWMFQQRVPPIVAFHLGSLGFLTNFSFESYRPTMTNIIRGEGMNLNLRMRLQCCVYKFKDVAVPDLKSNGTSSQTVNGVRSRKSETEDSGVISDSDDDSEELWERAESFRKEEVIRTVKEMDSKHGVEVADLGVCHENGQTLITRTPKPKLEDLIAPTDTWQVLNEVTVDRGSNAGMLQLELFVDGIPVTTILADGLVIATSTGSTAYSEFDFTGILAVPFYDCMSFKYLTSSMLLLTFFDTKLSIGGSLIHPEKNSVIVSPIAPHSLTARPMIIPGTKHLRICVPVTSRTTAWASFDGRHRQELGHGDSIMITASRYPVTTICRRDQSTDWFTGLTQVLNWNSRVSQKPFGPHL
ncbi:hypothetical protein BGX34_009967 [Mortierella sp. NVP85]|nr:hypothetical protein BGX34_009967 [Mortierella sp. NVP85]